MLHHIDYLQHHLLLQDDLLHNTQAFVLLTVHNFYEPTLKLSPLELIEHRAKVTPSNHRSPAGR